MIWYALRVPVQKEFLAERILREEGLCPFVPVKHVAKRKSPDKARKQLLAYPQLPGLVFVGFEPDAPLPWGRIRRFEQLVLGAVTDDRGTNRRFTEDEIIRICGHSQRPHILNAKRRRKGPRIKANAEIVSGPYQGKVVKVIEREGGREADELYELGKTRT